MTCCFRTAFRPTAISMDVTGGVAERQPSKTFEPTFWSAQSFAHVRDREEGPGLALFTAIPAAVGALGTGMEWIVARNAGKERAFGLLPIPAFPARGDESYLQVFDYAIVATSRGDWHSNGLHSMASDAITPSWRDPAEASVAAVAERAVGVDNPDVRVLAVKPACDGRGHVIRLMSYARGPLSVKLNAGDRKIFMAELCDSFENDLCPAAVKDGKAVVPAAPGITSVRIRT